MDPTTLRLFQAASYRAQSPYVLQSGYSTSSATINFTSTPSSGQLILFFGQKGGSDVGLPTGYTTIVQRTGSNCRFLAAYKVSNGTETSVTSSNADVVGYAVLSGGATLNVTGTVDAQNADATTSTGITAQMFSTVFVFGACNGKLSSAITISPAATSAPESGWVKLMEGVSGDQRSLTVYYRIAGISYTTTTSPNTTLTFPGGNPTVSAQFSIRF